MVPKIEFRRPYFVTPHAMKRFRERVLSLLGRDLQDLEIVQIINAALQVRRDPAWTYWVGHGKDRQLSRVYPALYAGVRYYIPAVKNPGREWLYVPTILGPDMGQKPEDKNDERNQA